MTERSNSPRDFAWHRVLLGIVVPILGCNMLILANQRVAFSFAPKTPLPDSCISHRLGFDCPFCGLTRSVVSICNGNFFESLCFHPLGWLVFAIIVLQVPYGIQIIMLRHPWQLPSIVSAWISAVFAAAFLVSWLIRM